MPLILTLSEFKKEVLFSECDVIVDFYADWCHPCTMMAPVLEQIEKSHPELKVCKLNVDDSYSVVVSYQISSIPAVFLFRRGEVAAKSIGYKSGDELLSELGL